MQHEDFCNTTTHKDPLDETQAPTPCIGPVQAEAGPTAAWLVQGERGTMVDQDHQPGVSIPVQAWWEYCRQGMDMAVAGGAVPRQASETS